MRSAEHRGTLVRSRLISPYSLSLVVVPALMAVGPVKTVPMSATLATRLGVHSEAASDLGATLDEVIGVRLRDLQEKLHESMPVIPDVAFLLHPNRRTIHQGRVVWRDRPVRLAETSNQFDHLL